MTITNQYITTFLSSYKIYEYIKDTSFYIQSLNPYIFIETRNSSDAKIVPDYVFKEVESTLFKNDDLSYILNCFFDKLASMLYFKNNNIYVKEEYFQEWQEVITRVSPLIIIAYFIYKNAHSNDYDLIDKFANSLLPCIYNKRLDYMLNNSEIYDLHIHLNGTTESDIVWQDLLKTPKRIISDYIEGFKKNNVKEEYFELGIFDIVSFKKNIYEVIKFRKQSECNYSIECEISFFIDFFKKLDRQIGFQEVESFYKYILIYNTNYKLLVQQLNQIGFDNFQKITDVEIREFTEKDYKKRFQQIKTIYNHDNIKLEGRFAPRKDMYELVKRIDSIKNSLQKDLNLVGHFIKKKDIYNYEIVFYKDKKLRAELKVMTNNMIRLLSKSEYRKLINGFDAAANELHAKPEVFASSFKKLRSFGYNNFTFHGGEDFIDLVSGIRYIYEIIDFLEFDSGNRIGHATAIGIDPKLWQKRVGQKLYISRGEYLDNLIFVYFLLQGEKKFNKIKPKLEEKIYKYCSEIYNKTYNIQELIEAWKLRKKDPEKYFKTIDENSISQMIYSRYHTDKMVIEKYNQKIEFETCFFSSKELKRIQNIVIKVLNKKNIIIESMLSSNKMISFYKSYKEHHISRWLLKSPKPIVVLATDDPGIFATNIKNEFAHLYLILKEKLDNEEEIFEIIQKLILNAKIYMFNNE